MRKHLLTLACAALLGAPASAVTIDWVTVGDPGNACDTQPQGCFGSVASVYPISKFETTNAQYAEFLNAKRIGTTTGGFTSDSVQCDNSRGELGATLLR